MGDSSATAWGSAPFPPRSCRAALAPRLPLVSPPYGAGTWFLEAERELRRAGAEAWVACVLVVVIFVCFFLGTCALSTFRDPGN